MPPCLQWSSTVEPEIKSPVHLSSHPTPYTLSALGRSDALLDIGDDVGDGLDADRQPD
eukprot:CAMPEP_0205920150 /NCGR_PEP_ID=MMETSP1325-20131115/10896_1 /ASSEMBLY_ACC=CAM_ASM_000708 /TAXON_ID=236786 /ORGANISM="Florenciella sp., Strain RCC1007" /LENGTH=57 /DNA_ID=CAMNT_0053287817 /DNA_START=164 /DNA_END=334 /DNA_ORIENTATION=-